MSLKKLLGRGDNKPENTYSFKELREDNKIFILRFKNDLWKYAESKKYPFQIGIAVPLNGKGEYPDKDENDQLLAMKTIKVEYSNCSQIYGQDSEWNDIKIIYEENCE